MIKSAGVTMQNIILLQQEVNQLCASNQHQKRDNEMLYSNQWKFDRHERTAT